MNIKFSQITTKLFIILFTFFAYAQNTSAFTGLGSGTELDPFQISTCEQLQEMNGEFNDFYIIVNNIDCSASATWNPNDEEWVDGVIGGTLIDDQYVGVENNGYYGFEPIGQADAVGNGGAGFTGSLDGQGYTISNLWIFRKDTDFNGLIGYATGATIKNITFTNARIVGGSSTGSVLGYGDNVLLENIVNNLGMVRAYLSYNGGGIAGQFNNNSTSTLLSVNQGNVHGSGNIIGGLIGRLYDSYVANSSTTANVDGGEYIGGAFGDVSVSRITNVNASGNVDSNDGDDLYIEFFSKNSNYTGGFVGRLYNSEIENSTASGSVTSEGNYTGGFAGQITSSSIISNNSSSGNVSGDQYVGGFSGSIESGSVIGNSTALGEVNSISGNAGGFAGFTNCESSFFRVSAFGNVSSPNDYVGGFVGSDGCEGPGSSFSQVSAHGNASSSGNYIGGFIGNSFSSTFTDVYASGNVYGGQGRVGGFAGYSSNSILNNTYSRGLVIANDLVDTVAGFIGESDSNTIGNSFYDMNTSNQVSDCGIDDCAGVTSLTTLQAKTLSTYTDASWDFGAIWRISSENDEYPHFQWESLTPLAGSGTIQDPYQVTQCFTARQSGYYRLQNNILDVYGIYCIGIEANNVYIDGAGYTIGSNPQNGGMAIFSEDYDSISISNITLDGFNDGIRLENSQGTSTISNVNIFNMDDDGIEINGISNMSITDSVIEDINDEAIRIFSYYDGQNDVDIDNFNITIRNNDISNTGDFGMRFENITNLLVIENEISNTDDDAINALFIEDSEISNNTIENTDSDGIYIEEGNNILISENTINNSTGGDGIDLDADANNNSNIRIINNTITNIYDNALEIYQLLGGVISGNILNSFDKGIYITDSENIEFSGNTITPTVNNFYVIPKVTTTFSNLDIINAVATTTGSNNNQQYTLPFTLNYFRRSITSIYVSSEGAIELLENGETCSLCGGNGTYRNSLYGDIIFASFDSINMDNEGDHIAIFNQNDEYVVVEWQGSTMADSDSVQYPIKFQVKLYPNGTIQWDFVQMDFQLYWYDMFTGAHNGENGNVYKAGFKINELSSYSGDFSGNTNYTSQEEFNNNVGLNLIYVSNSSFIGNDIHASKWVETENIENVVFNDNDSGNTYKLLNGQSASTRFNIIDTDGNGYADSGNDRPFSQSKLGTLYWTGSGEDDYPKVIMAPNIVPVVATTRSAPGSGPQTQTIFKKEQDREKESDSDKTKENTNTNTNSSNVSTIRDLQRFLNINGFPIAKTGPGSLNNETDRFGPLTKQALIRFQKANGILPAVGIFGPKTKAFINKSKTTSTSENTSSVKNLDTGSTGTDVVKLQEVLIKAGYSIPSGATGRFGPQTKKALIKFQKANNIKPASGNFGPITRALVIKKMNNTPSVATSTPVIIPKKSI